MVFGGAFQQVLRPAFDAGAAFIGAYDAIPNIIAAYGMRRLRSAYSGSILRIRRSSDSAEQDIGYTAAGDLDTAAVATFIGGGSGYVRTWYDQSGNAYDASQTTADNQPLYVASGQNGRPVGRFDGGNDILSISPTGINFERTDAWTLFSVCKIPGALDRDIFNRFDELSDYRGYRLGALDGRFLKIQIISSWAGNNHISVRGSTVIGTTSFYLLCQTYAGNSLASGVGLYVNGNTETPTVLSDTLSTTIQTTVTGDIPGTQNPANNDYAEFIICNTALSDANRQAAEAAANNYWAVY